MKVTFLVGNGFDLQMGLRTSFRDIVSNYVSIQGKDENFVAFQKELADRIEYWSNFEEEIGNYTSQFEADEQEKFTDLLIDFLHELSSYLQKEEDSISYDLVTESIQKEFPASIKGFANGLTRYYRNQVDNLLNVADPVEFKFVTFNYTHTLEICLSLAFEDNPIIGEHIRSGTRFKHTVDKSVLHIHGELPSSMVTGVDNVNQIKNRVWAENRRFQQVLVKPATNERVGRLADQDLKHLIDESSIICIYGMSLGVTDATWWEQIGDWLKRDNHRLIIYAHKRNDELQITDIERTRIENNKRDEFMKVAGISEEDQQQLLDRIFVVDTALFSSHLKEQSELIEEWERQSRKDLPSTNEDFIHELERQTNRPQLKYK